MAVLSANALTRTVAIGFIAGVLGILTFHQGTIAALQLIGGQPLSVYGMREISPFKVPQIVNSCFWGGLWGIAIVVAMRRFAGSLPGWAIAALVGVVATTAVAWFVAGPIRSWASETPLQGPLGAQGFALATIWRGPLINGMFGLGTGLFADFLSRRI